MNRLILILAVIFLTASQSFGQRKIKVEDIWQSYSFYPNYVSSFNFLSDGQHFTRLERNNIEQYDLRNGKQVHTVLNGNDLEGIKNIEGYSFSDNETKIILSANKSSIYRHSYEANFFVYDRESNELKEVLNGGNKVRLASLNSQGNKVAFVYENDLHIQDLSTGRVKQITTDGEQNKIINGATDWVYEEEFGDDTAFFWSPDGEQIAYYRFDETQVAEFTLANYHNGMYPDYVTFKYPKVGEKNSDVSIHIYDIASATSKQVATTDSEWEYFPRIKWTNKASELCVFYMNRHQNKLELRLTNFDGGNEVLLEEQSNYYIDIHDNLTFTKDGEQFIWTSEKDGWNHVYLYNMNGTLDRQLTTGKWEVTNFYGLDEENGNFYYQAARSHPIQREVYEQSLKASSSDAKPIAQQIGTNSAQFSSTFDYFVHTHSSANRPPSYTVINRQGKRIRLIEENADLQNLQKAYGTATVEFTTIKTEDDVKLNAYMIKPSHFSPKRVYPVLMYVYGGPGSQTVKDSWGGQNYWWFQMLAQQGYIVVSVDNRGTGGRGETFKKMTYQRLGYYETVDQIAAAKHLGSLPYIDANRIGIFGWSYGGYMSSSCLFKGNDVFKAAIAVAPVTNWKWYDSVYTERYMRTVEENEEGYRENSPVNFADQLKGNYLLVHGMGDDNVHFQHTAEMANALILANKQYDTYFYPNRSHSIYGDSARLHLFTKMTNFLNEHLRKTPPQPSRPSKMLRVEPMKTADH